MSKFLKNYILKEIASLCKKNANISEMMGFCNRDSLLKLLEDCQKSAIKIGELLEASDDKTMDIILKLEQYCEMLYEFSIMEDSEISHNKLDEELSDVLRKIKEEIERNITTKYEILFLPYKASMWDSLESIWQSAKEDKECVTYVMPIPYFNKDAEGNIAQKFYEGNDFPDYVPITDYHKYRIDIRKPDIIYIHNPYDQYNKVTTIAEEYYCKNIRQYTDRLVYIPYFIAMDEASEHFCVLPGTIYADQIILQSEKIKQEYITEFKKLVAIEKADEKFIALGSPKIDKIVNAKKMRIEIPEQWKVFIGNKKVVLYNTSVQCLIEQKEQYIRKIKYVLDFFRDNEKYVLLWRPHPLAKETMNSMLKFMAEEYEALINTYVKEQWGIYDDTAEFTRAILISDAYVGDMSSVVPLYLITRKPILIQNYDKIDHDYYDSSRLWFEDMIIQNGTAWISAGKFNGLFRMDIRSGYGDFIGRFPNEEDVERLYNGIIQYESMLIFTPMAANEIAIYDTLAKNFRKIKIDDAWIGQQRYNRKNKFFTSFIYKDWLIMGGGTFPAIIKYNLKTEELIYDDKWVNQVEEISEDKSELYFRKQYHLSEGKVLFPLCCTNAVLEYTILSGEFKIYRVGDANNRFNGICYDGNDYWLSPRRDGRLLRWKKDFGEWENFQCNDIQGNANKFGCSIILLHKNNIWLFPLESREVYRFDINLRQLSSVTAFQIEHDNKLQYVDNWSSIYSFALEDQELIYAYQGKKNHLLVYDPELNTVKEIIPIAKYNARDKEHNQYQDQYHIFHECDEMPLELFLSEMDMINDLPETIFEEMFQNLSGTCGKHIHSTIKKLIPCRKKL